MATQRLYLAALLGGLTLSPTAFAGKTTVSVDTDFVLPLGGDTPESSESDETIPAGPGLHETELPAGYSVTLRAGYKLSFVIVDVTPEVGLRSLQLVHGTPLTFVYGGA